ncbi:hypothetical protein DYB32_007632 [Aphanomyces invadans]|uniref:Peptidase A2 domain-containing protein n=1 Tax=Aphanomyces invadans TaxID=157072 RepID=A0A3R7A5A5_9STRA|nr:hypothetical protein DYB32_007632 [Aphanomyces invadans]
MYRGSTKRERCEFMDEYLAYSRRVQVLNSGMGGTLFLMPLAACIDQKIVPRVCAHDFGKPFEEFTENDWRDYLLSAREVQELGLDAVSKAMTSLKMDTKIRNAESRVGRLLADFYEKLEQLDVAHLHEQEPKQSVKILTAAIRPPHLKATVERQLMRETIKALKSDVRAFCTWLVTLLDTFMLFESQLISVEKKAESNPPRQYGDKTRRHAPSKRPDDRATTKTAAPAVQPGEAQRLLEQRFKKSHGAAVAAPDKKDETKRKVMGAAVEVDEKIATVCTRTVSCDINGVKSLALLDSGADQSVVSPTFLLGLEGADHCTLVVRHLDSVMELGGFMEDEAQGGP